MKMSKLPQKQIAIATELKQNDDVLAVWVDYVQGEGVIIKFDASACGGIIVSFEQFSNHGNR